MLKFKNSPLFCYSIRQIETETETDSQTETEISFMSKIMSKY